MQVEGKQLLDVCGYSYIEATTGGRQKSQSTKVINRQIKKHSLMEGVDFNIGIDDDSISRVKPSVYQFTINAFRLDIYL